jgi:rubrerythrin
MVMVVPRCLAGISPETLKKLKLLLESQKETDTELKEAIDRMIDMTNKEIQESEDGEKS